MLDYESVECDLYKKYIDSKLNSPFAKEILSELDVKDNIYEIKKVQNCIKESILFTKDNDVKFFDDNYIFDLKSKFHENNTYLGISEFTHLKAFLEYLRYFKESLKNFNNKGPLSQINNKIDLCEELYNKLDNTFDDEGNIKANANSELKEIRSKLATFRNKIYNRLKKYIYSNESKYFIADDIITERYNRYLIMCKSNFRSYIKAVVVDISRSGSTYYVEPIDIVELNNHYRELRIKEDEIIRKIIESMNIYLKDIQPNILNTLKNYSLIVFYLELGLFLKDEQIAFPEFTERIYFKNVHHPLIYLKNPNKSVPIDYKLDNDIFLSVITGPNAGGKSAAIKSIGINILIAKTGLPLFGEFAEVINCSNLLCDIGDKQSITMDLSSFTAHLLNLKTILAYADAKSIVLLDEPGSNTEPRKGSALAISVIRDLIKRKSKVIVASHYEDIKAQGLLHEYANIYAVSYDYEKNIPKYKLIEGFSGESSPFIIARNYNIPDHIIDNAIKIYDDAYSEKEKTLDEIKELQSVLSNKLNLADKYLSEIERFYNIIYKKWKDFEYMLHQKEEKVLQEAHFYLLKSKRLLKENKKLKKEAVNNNLKIIENKLDNLKEYHNYPKDICIGDKIKLEKLGKVAEVLELKGKKVLINIENKKIYIDKRELKGVKVQNKDEKINVIAREFTKAKNELNLVGKTIEEALEELNNFISVMLSNNVEVFYIIHGRGTGRLKKAVHEYLKSNKYVKAYRIASADEGGDAITIVDI